MGVGGQPHAPAASTPGKDPVPIVQEAGGPQGWSGQVGKISPPTGIRSPDWSWSTLFNFWLAEDLAEVVKWRGVTVYFPETSLW